MLLMEIFWSYVATNMHRFRKNGGKWLDESGSGAAGEEKVSIQGMYVAAAELHGRMFVPADAAGGAAGRPDHGTGRSRAGRDDGRVGSRPRRLRRRRSCPGQRPVGKGHQFRDRVGGGKRIGRTGGQGDPDSAGGRLPLRGRNHRHQGPQAGRPSAAGEYRVGKSGGCVFEHSYERIPQPQ